MRKKIGYGIAFIVGIVGAYLLTQDFMPARVVDPINILYSKKAELMKDKRNIMIQKQEIDTSLKFTLEKISDIDKQIKEEMGVGMTGDFQ